MKPNKKDIRKWCAALRSGKYKQTTGQLEKSDGLCCLGLACKIFIPAKDLAKEADGLMKYHTPDRQAKGPEWLKRINNDFFENNSRHGVNDKRYYLHELNDILRLSFDEIADVLEAVYIHEVLG